MEQIEFVSPTLNERGEVLSQARHSALQVRENLGKGVLLELLLLPAGVFYMGSPYSDGHPEEQPRHFVTIKAFLMGKLPVTQRQWMAVMGKRPPCRFKGDHVPVERVTWNDANQFCDRLSKRTGRRYRLPSESQWEYACRAGTSSAFSFGDTLTVEVANFNGEHTYRAEPRGFYRHVTTEGQTFPPNAFGLFDMHGNVWEWCADSWLEEYSPAPRDGTPFENRASQYRVARGGSWHEPARLCRSAARLRVLESEADECIGFRVVCEQPDQVGL